MPQSALAGLVRIAWMVAANDSTIAVSRKDAKNSQGSSFRVLRACA
jgi:hypothetical protein